MPEVGQLHAHGIRRREHAGHVLGLRLARHTGQQTKSGDHAIREPKADELFESRVGVFEEIVHDGNALEILVVLGADVVHHLQRVEDVGAATFVYLGSVAISGEGDGCG